MSTAEQPRKIVRPVLLIAGILLIAASLRAPFTSVAPVLGMIRESFSLGTAEAGLLTTLPILAFAAVSPFAVLIARAFGMERSLFGALLLVVGAIAVRSSGPVWCLYLGTAGIGAGIAVCNVLLPSLLKRDFPHRVAALTGAYAVTSGATAALASAIVVPLAERSGFGLPGLDGPILGWPSLGWQGALGLLAILPLAAMAMWLPQLGGHSAPAKGAAGASPGGGIWRSPLAWQVSLFMGLNSFIYYVVIGWLPAILVDAGYSPVQAGSLHGVMQLATAVPGLLLGAAVGRLRDQRAITVGMSAVAALSLAGLLAMPQAGAVWAALFGFGSGGAFMLGLSFMSLRAATAPQAAALSGMAQCVGYLMAAAGPPLIGVLHDLSGGWRLPLAVVIALCVAMAGLGSFAGRARHV